MLKFKKYIYYISINNARGMLIKHSVIVLYHTPYSKTRTFDMLLNANT